MLTRTLSTAAGGFFVLATLMGAQASAAGVSQKECSAKYQAAKAANTLNGMKYAAFRKANCGATAETTPETTTPAATQTSTPATTTTTTTATPAATTPSAPASAAVFPTAVSPKYASEKPGRARMHTCDDQYKANKATNANGGLKWIQKGGGYWSLCNKHLKGAA